MRNPLAKQPWIAFPRLRVWRANRLWKNERAEIAEQAEREGWPTEEMRRELRSAAHRWNERCQGKG